jgi:hypothetical protein
LWRFHCWHSCMTHESTLYHSCLLPITRGGANIRARTADRFKISRASPPGTATHFRADLARDAAPRREDCTAPQMRDPGTLRQPQIRGIRRSPDPRPKPAQIAIRTVVARGFFFLYDLRKTDSQARLRSPHGAHTGLRSREDRPGGDTPPAEARRLGGGCSGPSGRLKNTAFAAARQHPNRRRHTARRSPAAR